ncbi:hypothetical protein [Pedobacter sp. BMA]|uniref:hypothetical protein n=1 Tax=Pedobacter sp. BMA TaxID=1663685 RepID=UPI00064AF5E8|nr:hypothetical protein [Pedobacter sp. BMA]KLT66613.1 hypothetical protein AB669_05410 [Pedobacter sp. BMA]
MSSYNGVGYIAKILLTILILGLTNSTKAATIVGCLLDGGPGVIYTSPIGQTKFHGNGTYKVYNRNGAVKYKVYNPVANCDEYSPSEIRSHSEAGYAGCWVNTYVNATDNQDGAAYGSWVEVDERASCVATLPIDDYVPFLLIPIGLLIFIYMREKNNYLSQ